jgi:allantoate deiminase/N-carbamoyl-L-amino-acid hydrolase
VDLPPRRYRASLDTDFPGTGGPALIALQTLNELPRAQFIATLGAVFEHSPWVAERVEGLRPFAGVRALHAAMSAAVSEAGVAAQLALIRAHPELAGRAAVRGELTLESTREQRGAGLSACTPAQYARLQSLNDDYRERFGFPFILAVKGHTPDSVIAELARRVGHAPDDERRVALEQISRIARFRLADLVSEPLGAQILDMAAELAGFSERAGGLTCTYLTPTHRATANCIRDLMLAAGLEVRIDAVGNVRGLLPAAGSAGPRLLTGSHYDTVIDAGRFDGRLGILLPIAVAARLRRGGRHLPFDLEVVAFAEEEGVRFRSTFLGSRALAGRFEPELFERRDAQGLSLRAALVEAGLDASAVPELRLDPAGVLGFIEVHIEQGPVLLAEGLAVGVVTAIAGCSRRGIALRGESGHAGTVPMKLRRDAAAGAAEIVLAVESRSGAEADLVGTVGRLEVPGGAINVIAGRCELTLDLRAGEDALRLAALRDIDATVAQIAERRGLTAEVTALHDVGSVVCDRGLQQGLAESVLRVTGQAARHLPSGAGHDAMMMANVAPIGMLFVRCGNGGVSHNPLETLSADDADVAAQVFEDFLVHFEAHS